MDLFSYFIFSRKSLSFQRNCTINVFQQLSFFLLKSSNFAFKTQWLLLLLLLVTEQNYKNTKTFYQTTVVVKLNVQISTRKVTKCCCCSKDLDFNETALKVKWTSNKISSAQLACCYSEKVNCEVLQLYFYYIERFIPATAAVLTSSRVWTWL